MKIQKKRNNLGKNQLFLSDCTLVVPSQYQSNRTLDKLMDQILSQLCSCKARVQLEVKEATAISKQDGVVVVPCIIGLQSESDMDKTISSVQLGKCKM